MSDDYTRAFFDAEHERIVRLEHARELAVYLLTAKDFVASHYPGETENKASLEIAVASSLLAARSNERLYLLVNDLMFKLTSKEER